VRNEPFDDKKSAPVMGVYGSRQRCRMFRVVQSPWDDRTATASSTVDLPTGLVRSSNIQGWQRARKVTASNPTQKITAAVVLSVVEPLYHASTAISPTTGGVSRTANDGASFSCRRACNPFMIEMTTNKKNMLPISKQKLRDRETPSRFDVNVNPQICKYKASEGADQGGHFGGIDVAVRAK
jgi:hypothetical protein